MSEAFDLIAFRDFCAGKPAGEIYPMGSHRCALAQFGLPGLCFSDVKNDKQLRAAYEVAVWDGPATWGALASRLSNLIGEGGNG